MTACGNYREQIVYRLPICRVAATIFSMVCNCTCSYLTILLTNIAVSLSWLLLGFGIKLIIEYWLEGGEVVYLF